MIHPRPSERGLTLIELLVSLLIVGGMFAMVLPTMQSAAGVQVKEAAGKLSGAIASLYNHTALVGETCRLTFHLPEDEDDLGGYQAQCTAGSPQMKHERATVREGRVEDEEEEDEFSSLREDEQFEARIKAKAAWTQFAASTQHKPVEFARGVRIAGVWTPRVDDVITRGDAHLYFFPLGETQRAYIWMQDANDNYYTLTVEPLTGRVKVHPENLEVPDA